MVNTDVAESTLITPGIRLFVEFEYLESTQAALMLRLSWFT
jgi:hypothetical protein